MFYMHYTYHPWVITTHAAESHEHVHTHTHTQCVGTKIYIFNTIQTHDLLLHTASSPVSLFSSVIISSNHVGNLKLA